MLVMYILSLTAMTHRTIGHNRKDTVFSSSSLIIWCFAKSPTTSPIGGEIEALSQSHAFPDEAVGSETTYLRMEVILTVPRACPALLPSIGTRKLLIFLSPLFDVQTSPSLTLAASQSNLSTNPLSIHQQTNSSPLSITLT